MSSVALIIPAAGSGSRMKQSTPKPFIRIGGLTILEHTLRCFAGLHHLHQVIVASSPEYISEVSAILKKAMPSGIKTKCVEGGAERQESILRALPYVDEVDLIAVHDAVRPFVHQNQIETCCKIAFEHGGAVLGIPAKDTIKKVDSNRIIRETPDRKKLWLAQTPQVFRKNILLRAYKKAQDDQFTGTDDASLVERLNVNTKMVTGEYTNIKITYPLDLKIARLLINQKK